MSEEPNLDDTVITSDSQFIALTSSQGCQDGRVQRLLTSVGRLSDSFTVSYYFYKL
jgi:hypothetical protein